MTVDYSIAFAPLLPAWMTAIFAIALFALCALSLRQSAAKSLWRLAFGILILLFMVQPQLATEKRTPLRDIVLIATDKSASEDLGKRNDVAAAALARLQEQFKKAQNLEVRTIDVAMNAADETKIFDEIEPALSDVPESQRAGVIVLTDGQVADTPSPELVKSAPLHVILTGSRQDKDREIKIINAPGYSVLGETVLLKFRVEDHNMGPSGPADIRLNLPDGTVETRSVPVGEDETWPLKIENAGQNIFELSTDSKKDEISSLNNRAVISVQGVRNRLHVLLVSGEPYPGARMWRDLLKSDPGVDLVHFTILRSPDRIDNTPTKELSLIAFPFQELFERKLKDFDLVIMDRFSLNTVLPDYYFNNIKNYVLDGGALLEINGPSFATPNSMYNTPLGELLPGRPSGPLLQQEFKPQVTPLGKTHPVTMALNNIANWGSWLQQLPVHVIKGDVLMTGIGGNPLLILERAEKGRVAQLTSDQMWLWARGFQGGGPTTELLRRIVHWLMKEPELDENALDIKSDDTAINIRTRDLGKGSDIQVIKPDGSVETLKMAKGDDGWLSAGIMNAARGIYKFSDGERQKIISVGDVTTPEFANIITTDKNLAPFVTASKGTIVWAGDRPDFTIPLRRNNSSSLISAEMKPLLPPEILLSIGLLAGLALWWNESRRKKTKRAAAAE